MEFSMFLLKWYLRISFVYSILVAVVFTIERVMYFCERNRFKAYPLWRKVLSIIECFTVIVNVLIGSPLVLAKIIFNDLDIVKSNLEDWLI